MPALVDATGEDLELSVGLLRLLNSVFADKSSPTRYKIAPDLTERVCDTISYAVATGIVDRISQICASVKQSVEEHPLMADCLEEALELLTFFTVTCPTLTDQTRMIETLKCTELLGAVSMLYGVALPIGQAEKRPPTTLKLAASTFALLKSVARIDLKTFQMVVGADGISLQFRHVCNILLEYCGSHTAQDREMEELVNDVIVVLGLFVVRHKDNQMVLISGPSPCVLTRLADLPLHYFIRPPMRSILFSALLAAIDNNPIASGVLYQEMDLEPLDEFRQSTHGRENALIQMMDAAG